MKQNNSKIKKAIVAFLGFFVVALIFATFLFLNHVQSGLPELEQLENPTQSLASNVYSVDGELIGQFFRENRIKANIDSIPNHLVNSLIATEDRKFYTHWGVDLDRLYKALIKTFLLGKREGASTITQQLSKNLYELKLGHETFTETLVRKVREWITAIQIEKTYSKEEILEMYFNESYFGSGAYGIEMASRVYFNKTASQLNIEEGAILIALLKSSVYYNPVKRYNSAIQRRNLVMYNMVEAEFLEKAVYDSLKNLPIDLTFGDNERGFVSKIAPHFVEDVRQQMERMADRYGYNLYEDGLSIYTTLHSEMQRIAVNETIKHMEELQLQFDNYWKWTNNREILDEIIKKAIYSRKDYRNAKNDSEKREIFRYLSDNIAFVDSVQKAAQRIEVGFVVIDVKTGEIRAMVGGRDQSFKYGLNHVTQIRRQPGSSFKPIIYTVALDNGLYPSFPILNQPFSFPSGSIKDWSPKNFDRSTGGFTTLREALMRSLNLVSARLVIEGHVDLWKVGSYASRLGIKSKLNLVPAISLGAAEVTPLELTSAYATFANHGIYNEPFSILKIEDSDGIVLDNFASKTSEAISEETAFLISDMLRSVIDEGSVRRIRFLHKFSRPAGGKTGTTNDYADAWFLGFTPQLAAGVWVGFDDRRVTFTGAYGQGGKAATPIWANFMREVYDSLDIPLEDFVRPSSGNIVTVSFCKESIYKYGNPKIFSQDCNSGKVTDYINLKDIPETFISKRDTSVNINNKYWIADGNSSHEAVEVEIDSE